MRYSGITPHHREQMLEKIGVSSVQDLFSSVPSSVRMNGELNVRGPVPEARLLTELDAMKVAPPRVSLVGGGLYHHFIPSVVDSLVARSEWVTSYTPYQPETSQGTLVMYYEFQTYVAMLTGQEIANGGMYDGSTALAEAVLMARRIRPKTRIVYLSEGVHPEYRKVLLTYLQFQDAEVRILPIDRATGQTTVDVSPADQNNATAVVLQSPNYFGVIEDSKGVSAEAFRIHVVTEAQSLALVPPLAADVTVGEIQSFGIPVQLGGPTSGIFATKREHVRQLPGRLVGKSVDRHGQEAFCITLATREQFIRREKATSNICTASGLMCLRAAVYLSLLGRRGIQDLARKSSRAALAFQKGMEEIGLLRRFKGPIFNEFVLNAKDRPGLYDALRRRGFLLGIPLEKDFPDLKDQYLCALTEVQYPNVAQLIKEVKDCAHNS